MVAEQVDFVLSSILPSQAQFEASGNDLYIAPLLVCSLRSRVRESCTLNRTLRCPCVRVQAQAVVPILNVDGIDVSAEGTSCDTQGVECANLVDRSGLHC